MGGRILRAVADVVHLVRYRFLLFAGLLPFGLGQAIALHETGAFQASSFFVALVGLAFVLIGVEAFNEYFDARIGTDRVFTLEREEIPQSRLILGIAAFAMAALVMVILTLKLGWPVSAFAIAGFMAAGFYVTPPVKLAYRGLGELAILISYGPLMTAGSYFIQVRKVDAAPFIASVIPALLILCVTVMNEIPDFFGDRIVGKRNFTVRLGRERVIFLFAAVNLACFAFILSAVLWGFLPRHAWLAMLPMPFTARNFFLARRHFNDPRAFIPAIRGTVQTYTVVVILLTISYLL